MAGKYSSAHFTGLEGMLFKEFINKIFFIKKFFIFFIKKFFCKKKFLKKKKKKNLLQKKINYLIKKFFKFNLNCKL